MAAEFRILFSYSWKDLGMPVSWTTSAAALAAAIAAWAAAAVAMATAIACFLCSSLA